MIRRNGDGLECKTVTCITRCYNNRPFGSLRPSFPEILLTVSLPCHAALLKFTNSNSNFTQVRRRMRRRLRPRLICGRRVQVGIFRHGRRGGWAIRRQLVSHACRLGMFDPASHGWTEREIYCIMIQVCTRSDRPGACHSIELGRLGSCFERTCQFVTC